MAKKELDRLETLLKERHQMDEQQNKKLDQILMCIKGSASMNIEGLIPAQKRMQIQLDDLTSWKQEMNTYLGLISNRKAWRVLLIIGVFIISIFLFFKDGFVTVWKFLKSITV